MLQKLRYQDYYKGIHIECYTDGYAYTEYDELYLLSVLGYDSAVKGITSAAVSGREIQIITDFVITIYASRSERYRILNAKLRSGLLHQIVAAESFFTQEGMTKIIHVTQEQNIPEIVYQKIQQTYSVPLLLEWSDWLYKKVLQKGWVERLEGTVNVLKLDLHEKALDELISEGVKNQEIMFTERRKEDARADNQRDSIPQSLWP
jgi:hypothetical protein